MATPYYMGGLLDEDARSYFTGAAPMSTSSFRGMLAAHDPRETDWYRPGSEKFKREAGVAAMREDPSGIAVLPSPLDSDFTRLRREFMRGEPSVIEKSMPMMREDVSPYIDADRMLGPVSLETSPTRDERLDTPRFFNPFGAHIRSPEKGVIGARYVGDDDPRDELKYGWIHSDYDKYWDRIDAYTKLISDHIAKTGMTAEEVERDYGDRILPASDAIYHPDFDTEGYWEAEEADREKGIAVWEAEKLAEDLAYIEEKKAAELLLDPIDRGRPGWMTEAEWAKGRDERLDVPDVRTYTPDTGEAVSSALLDAIISPAAAGSMTPGRMSAADEYTALEMLRKEEADKAVLGEYAERYGASPDKDFADYSKITTGRLFEDLGISPDLDTRGLEMYPETYTYPKASEAELMGRDADIRYGDWESIRPDMTPSLSSLTKEADYVLGGDPYYGRRPAMIGRTPPAPEEPGFLDTILRKASDLASPAIDYAKDVYDVRSKEIRDIGETISSIPGDLAGLLEFFYTGPMETAGGTRKGYRDLSDPLRDLLDPDPYRRKALDPFPRMADPTFYEGPEGYSSITGTFYPTAAEIAAAEAAASEPLT